jgi:D-methionine transport system ATP-binding protein
MITLKNIQLRFSCSNAPIEAVKDVSLHIDRGEIFGIVGTGGAGKSI